MARLPIPQLRIPWLTICLCFSLITVFYVWPFSGELGCSELAALGASSRQLIADSGEWWRLLGANWLHDSPRHLWWNVILLLNIGALAELFLYRLDLLLVYFAGGIMAMLASLIFAPEVVAYGSSGLVFAALGALATLCYRYRRHIRPAYRTFLLIALPVYGLIMVALGFFSSGIAAWAHLGGFVCGLLLGLFLVVLHPHGLVPHIRRKMAVFAILVLLMVFTGQTCRTAPYPFLESHYGVTFQAPNTWTLHEDSSSDYEDFWLENGLGVVLHYSAGLQKAAIKEPLKLERTIGSYHYVLAFSAPPELFPLYDRWWQLAVNSFELGEPWSLKDARRRLNAPLPALNDYLNYANELLLFGEYDDGLLLYAELLDSAGEQGLLSYQYASWLDRLDKEPAKALELARAAVDQLGAAGQPLQLLLHLLHKNERYGEMESYLLDAASEEAGLDFYRNLVRLKLNRQYPHAERPKFQLPDPSLQP